MEDVDRPATEHLAALRDGDARAAAKLLPLVYDELRALAARYLAAERPDRTLQPTALVHEAYLRLVHVERIDWQGRAHFLALAATTLRRVLVDHARAKLAPKRGGGVRVESLDAELSIFSARSADLVAVEAALGKLAHMSPVRLLLSARATARTLDPQGARRRSGARPQTGVRAQPDGRSW